MTSRQTAIICTLFLGAPIVCFMLYSPALHGPFVFDDWANLPALNGFGDGIHRGMTFWWYVLGNNSGPLGRPLSMLSFLINDSAWPSDPYSFKYTNLLLHMLNGVLVFACLRGLLRRCTFAAFNAELIALLTAGIWLLHPIHTATVLQVVQRMTLLSSLFILLGVLSYLSGCARLETGRIRTAWLLLVPGIATCGLLGILCKETGALLPFYLLALHLTLAPLPACKGRKIWIALFLCLPAFLLCAYFVVNWPGIRSGYAVRDFTLQQRLLTEPRILVDYLRQILAPNYIARGLLFDGYPASTGWLSPLGTLLSVLLLALAVVVSIVKRKTWPWLAFVVFWFLAGHLLESTVIALELFFLHRNYLAMIAVPLAIAVLLIGRDDARRRLGVLVLVLYGGLLAWQTAAAAHVWSSELSLGATWAKQQPHSYRAHQLLASAWYTKGRPDLAESALDSSLRLTHPDASTALQWIYVRCANAHANPNDWERVLPIIRASGLATAAPDAFDKLGRLVGRCSSVTNETIKIAMDAFLNNDENMHHGTIAAEAWRVKAEFAAKQGDLNTAITSLEKSYAARKNILTAVRAASLLYSAGLDQDAQRFVDLANQTPPPTRWLRWFDIRPKVE